MHEWSHFSFFSNFGNFNVQLFLVKLSSTGVPCILDDSRGLLLPRRIARSYEESKALRFLRIERSTSAFVFTLLETGIDGVNVSENCPNKRKSSGEGG